MPTGLATQGGDTDGSPGISIYVVGHYLRAVVSTGEQYWITSALHHTPEGQWTVISCRWNETIGLELFMLDRENGTMTRLSKKWNPIKVTSSSPGLDPPRIMFGCHATGSDTSYRDFFSGQLDAFVVWRKVVEDMKWFPGGFRVSTRTLSELGKVLTLIPKTAEYVDAIISEALTALELASSEDDIDSTSTQEIISTGVDTAIATNTDDHNTTITILQGIMKMENCYELTNLQLSKLTGYLKSQMLFNNLLTNSEENKKKWDKLSLMDPKVYNLMNMAIGSADFMHCILQKISLEENATTEKTLSTENIYLKLSKDLVSNYKKGGLIVQPPMDTELDFTWANAPRLSISPYMFDDDRCDNRTLSITVELFRTIQNLNNLSVNPVDLDQNEKLEIDSVMMISKLDVDPVKFDDGSIDTSQPGCTIGQQKRYPMDMKFPHLVKSAQRTGRTLLFFEEESHSEIVKRYCAKFESGIGKYGEWDISSCKIASTDAEETRCLCKTPGQYVIISQKRDIIIIENEPQWLTRTKYILYGVSAFLILLYILVVLISGDLKDQFHLVGLNLCIAVLIGSIAMVVSDFSTIRDDQELCGAVSSLIFYFYFSAGTWNISLGHSCFKAITAGVIKGKLQSYIFMSWGLSLAALGAIYMFFLHDIGTDPRCFVAWENDVKSTLLGPQIIFAILAIFLSLVLLCNISTPALRKDNLIDDYGSFCQGASVVLFVFGLTWIFAFLAYLRLGIEKPDFYPIFTILNSSMGIVIFLCIGLGSNRFRTVITGQAKNRRAQLKSFAFGLPGSQKRQNNAIQNAQNLHKMT